MSAPVPRSTGLPLRMALLSAIGLMEAMVFGLTHPIFALNLQQQGFSESAIGFNATLGGLGVFLIGPFVPWLIARAGYRNYTVFCFLAAAAAIGALSLGPGYVGWCVSRLLLGVALGSLWILTEAWLNEIVPDAARGRANSIFQFCYSIGFMAGPGLVIAVGFAGICPSPSWRRWRWPVRWQPCSCRNPPPPQRRGATASTLPSRAKRCR